MNVTVLTAIGDPRREAELAAGLSDIDRGVTVVRRCVDLPDLLAAASAGLAQVAVLSADLRRLDRAAVRRLVDAGVAVVGLAPDDRDSHDRLRGLGVAHLLSSDSSVERVAAALVAAAAGRASLPPAGAADRIEPAPGPAEGGGGRIVAVWGPAGAPGRSAVALNLAAELAALGHDVLCADLDTYGASLGQHVGLFDEGSGIAAACRHANSGYLDAAALRALAVPVRPGLCLLTGVTEPRRWPELRPSALEAVLGLAKAAFGFTVVDVGFCVEQDEDLAYDTVAPRRNGASVAALEAADTVVAVASADPVSIARLVRAVPDLPCTDSPLTVVNRARRGVVGRGDPARQIARALGRYSKISGATVVPDDVATADAALASGRMWAEVAPSSPATAAMRDLARRIAGTGPTRRGLIRRLLKIGA